MSNMLGASHKIARCPHCEARRGDNCGNWKWAKRHARVQENREWLRDLQLESLTLTR